MLVTLYANTGNQNTALGAVALFSNTTGSVATPPLERSRFLATPLAHGNTANGVERAQWATPPVRQQHRPSVLIRTLDQQRRVVCAQTTRLAGKHGHRCSGALQHGRQPNTVNVYSARNTNDANTATGFEASTTIPLATTIRPRVAALQQYIAPYGPRRCQQTVNPGHSGNNVTSQHVMLAQWEHVSNSCYIGNIFGSTSSSGAAVFVNSNGRLGTMTSSARFKEAIKPMDKASEAILALRPVSFRYKKEIDPQGIREFGLDSRRSGKSES